MRINLEQSFYSSLSVAYRTRRTRFTILRKISNKCNEFEVILRKKWKKNYIHLPRRGEALTLVLPFFTYLFSTEFIQYKRKYVVITAIKGIKSSLSH